MNKYLEFLQDFKDMNPEEILHTIRAILDLNDEDKRKVHNLYVPEIVIEFFKEKNISQPTALENGMLLYMYLILWKEQNPLRFNTLEEFFISYLNEHHVILRPNKSAG